MNTMQAKQLIGEIRRLREFVEETADRLIVALSNVN